MLLSYRALIKNHEVTVEIVDHLTKTGEWTETKPPGKMFGSIYGDLRFLPFSTSIRRRSCSRKKKN